MFAVKNRFCEGAVAIRALDSFSWRSLCSLCNTMPEPRRRFGECRKAAAPSIKTSNFHWFRTNTPCVYLRYTRLIGDGHHQKREWVYYKYACVGALHGKLELVRQQNRKLEAEANHLAPLLAANSAPSLLSKRSEISEDKSIAETSRPRIPHAG
jgi:hypothetical protein